MIKLNKSNCPSGRLGGQGQFMIWERPIKHGLWVDSCRGRWCAGRVDGGHRDRTPTKEDGVTKPVRQKGKERRSGLRKRFVLRNKEGRKRNWFLVGGAGF